MSTNITNMLLIIKKKKLEHFDDNFPIVNFPFLCSHCPAAPAYRVYISQIPELVISIMIFLIEGGY
jgi:hypothetical protein